MNEMTDEKRSKDRHGYEARRWTEEEATPTSSAVPTDRDSRCEGELLQLYE